MAKLKELIAASKGKYNPFRIFSAKELEIATNNYDEQNVMRYELAYSLYKGFWQERQISVMKFDEHEYEDAYQRCINYIVFVSQMNHKNILRLIGCCLETEFPILVFESAEHGTLAERLDNAHQSPFGPLLLTHRLKIAMDIANALAYLHVGFTRPIIFRNISSSNILFNEPNVAKLFDLSISKFIPEGKTHVKSDQVSGTAYFAPEYFSVSGCNEKIDVFCFGMVLFEILTGKKFYDFIAAENDVDDEGHFLEDIAKKFVEDDRVIEILDPIVVKDGLFPWEEQKLKAFLQLTFKCVNESPEDRPTMVEVAKQLRQIYLFFC